ncbi:protein kinase domain-containing protein [Ditylenchus destructor]|uniref:non-specific serine/threonine protein kinase n=1 Tax=Ditylenchus destructor TaxID=166010 RepID=A0AAD4MRF6_9BILA|nr:protein kinase domain-containing protein [Ditylenchus destructor]
MFPTFWIRLLEKMAQSNSGQSGTMIAREAGTIDLDSSGESSSASPPNAMAPPKPQDTDDWLDTKVSMENFALIRVLGKGAYGKVFLVRKIGGHDSGKVYAMKVLKKTRVAQKQKTLEHTLAERKVLERLRGLPFLVNMAYAFQTDTKLHIVMEFVSGGELFTHLCKKKKFDVPAARIILAEIITALENIHKNSVIYRDLKLENILLDEEGHVILTDFEYMSPEIVKRTPDGYNECVDWWSLGVIAFELLTGCSPFTVDGDQNSTQDIAKRILSKKVPFPKTMDDVSRTFIGSLLTKEPIHRLGARGVEEIKKHKFFVGIDWQAIADKKVKPPIKPAITSNVDVHNFAPEFTNQPPFSDGLLGRGTFSVCRKCKRLSDGKTFAVKIVSQRFSYHAMREIRILELLNPHPNIVTIVDSMADPLHYYIVLELLSGGELLHTLRRMKKFTEYQAANIMSQLVSAVSHIHSKGVVHRDLKPENILFEADRPNAKLRLVDFGFARHLPNNSSGPTQLVTPCCGTLAYAAPEVLEIQDELPQYNQQCDLWSLGVILFTMLSGKVPFHAKSINESAADIISRIRVAEFSFEDPVWESVSDSAKDLINGLLTVDPKKRLSLSQLAQHPWLVSLGLGSTKELQTPTILGATSDETFNETINAFITANRDGFHLMDVDTAPLLVKRRGMKRRLEKEKNEASAINMAGGRKQSLAANLNILTSVPEDIEPNSNRRPTTLEIEVVEEGTKIPTPQASLFTDYRDNKPPYLKYSRDDFDVNDQKRHVNGTQVDTTTRSSGESSGSGGSH